MYSHIDDNRRRTWILIAVFAGVLAAAGYVYGQLTNSGYAGLVFALLVSLGMTSVSWFAGDKIVLASAGAQEITEREQAPLLWNTVENLAIAAGIPRPRIYVVDDPSPNAFATGRDPEHASIAVTTGSLQLFNNTELEGVLAHELSHVKNFDTRVMILAAVLVGALVLIGDLFFRGAFFMGGRRRDRNDNGLGALGMALGIIFLLLSPLIGQLIQLAVSRRREYLADASGALLTRYPEGLASALAKIRDAAIPLQHVSAATAHLWIANPGGEQSFSARLTNLFSTHPPIDDRIHQLKLMEDAK